MDWPDILIVVERLFGVDTIYQILFYSAAQAVVRLCAQNPEAITVGGAVNRSR